MATDSAVDQATGQREALELEKQRLECEKLRAEIGQVTMAWWKRPGYIGSLVPIILALAGVVSGWASGFFELERDARLRELNTQVGTLEATKGNLVETNRQLQKANEAIQMTMDAAYVRLKVATVNSEYALGLVQAMLGDLRQRLGEPPADAPVEFIRYAAQTSREVDLAVDILKGTWEDVKKQDGVVEAIPATLRLLAHERRPDSLTVDLRGIFLAETEVLSLEDTGKLTDPELVARLRKAVAKAKGAPGQGPSEGQ